MEILEIEQSDFVAVLALNEESVPHVSSISGEELQWFFENAAFLYIKSQSGVPVMTCEVNIRPSNETSMLYHERMGFRQVGSQETNGGKKEVAFMEKEL